MVILHTRKRKSPTTTKMGPPSISDFSSETPNRLVIEKLKSILKYE